MAARLLMYKYGEERNPIGYTLFFISTPLLITNWILLILYESDVTNFKWDENVANYIMLGIYLLFSICLECIYFQAGYKFVFDNNSMIVSGIYGFLGGFVRPLFHGIYVGIKYIVAVVMIFCVNGGAGFWLYGVPFLMELWLLGLFFARRKNRPSPCKCWELKVWRPFVEVFWGCAVEKYKRRNPKEVPNKIRWKDLGEKDKANAKEDSESLKDDELKKEKRHSRLVRTISQHADI